MSGESVDRLRQAAAQMRALAEAATPGPWRADGTSLRAESVRATKNTRETRGASLLNGGRSVVSRDDLAATTQYIAAMHPAVALALADWLDSAATTAEGPLPDVMDGLDLNALALADAFLGSL